MAFTDLFKNLVNLNDSDIEMDDLEENQPAEEIKVKREQPARRPQAERRGRAQADQSAGAMKVVIVRPEVFDEVKTIADNLVQGKTVVLNLETTNKDVARRVVDFMSGAAYTINYKLKKVAKNTFLIVPDPTDFAGEIFMDDYDEQNYYL
jgi:cell division inhibitor SepF